MPIKFLRIALNVLAVAALAAAITGCGGGGAYPATARVTGKVTYNGAAVAGATVSFSPEGNGNAAAGVTDASGNFKLTTFQAGDGALPGKYKVTVTKLEQSTVELPVGTAEDPSVAYNAAVARGADLTGTGRGAGPGSAAAKADQAPKDLLPAKYKNAGTTDLTAEVKMDGPKSFEFDLK